MNEPLPSAAGAVSQQKIVINVQYIKDLSFESPGAPETLVAPKSQPKIDLSVNINVQRMHENTFEVVLHIGAKATTEEKPLFLADLAYGGLFTLSNVPEEHKEMILLVHCPNILFPFARRIIADASRDGGFPPLMIDPIDFGLLYYQRQTAPKEDATVN